MQRNHACSLTGQGHFHEQQNVKPLQWTPHRYPSTDYFSFVALEPTSQLNAIRQAFRPCQQGFKPGQPWRKACHAGNPGLLEKHDKSRQRTDTSNNICETYSATAVQCSCFKCSCFKLELMHMLHCTTVQVDDDEPCPLECVRQIYKGEVIVYPMSQANHGCFLLLQTCAACLSVSNPVIL